MCTVVVRWAPDEVPLILALRDELTSRQFDDPAAWWPDQPTVIGGRDRTAGGSWCVTDTAAGTTALVLNRPQKRLADEGAPSRGVLPLLAVRHGSRWPSHLDCSGMASFALVLVTASALTEWEFDGTTLTSRQLGPGVHLVTSGGAEDGKRERYLDRFAAVPTAAGWQHVVEGEQPADDLSALVVRHEMGDRVYGTVFGQLIEPAPGDLRLSYSRTPWQPGTWTSG